MYCTESELIYQRLETFDFLIILTMCLKAYNPNEYNTAMANMEISSTVCYEYNI